MQVNRWNKNEIMFFCFFKTNLKIWTFLETLYDGQFDWGGRLLKSNGGVQR
jgi:hypothetical protein